MLMPQSERSLQTVVMSRFQLEQPGSSYPSAQGTQIISTRARYVRNVALTTRTGRARERGRGRRRRAAGVVEIVRAALRRVDRRALSIVTSGERPRPAGRPDRHDTRPHYRTVAFPPSMTDERRSRMVAEINCLVCDHNRQHAASRRSAAGSGSGGRGGREPRGSVSDRNESKPVVDVAAAASKSIVSPVNQ